MRQPAPVSKPVALTVAGSDSGGGAGVQADLKTFEAAGTYGASAVTAVTAQHTCGVESTHVLPPGEVGVQVDAVLDDFAVAAAKTGMLATADVVDAVRERFERVGVPLVVDPVMVAASGDRLLDRDAEHHYRDLLATATLATPNVPEAEVLTDQEIETVADARDAAHSLRETGVDAALVTGGHLDAVQSDDVVDVLATADGVTTYTHDRVADAATHGSGCTLSAAITAELANEIDESRPASERSTTGHERPRVAPGTIENAVEIGTDLLERAIRYHHDVGTGPGAVHHRVDQTTDAALPAVACDVEAIVSELETADADVAALLPEVGTNVVAAPATADTTADTVAVDGRLTATHAGVRATGGVRPGASSHVARFLLAAREHHPDLRYAANCRYDDAVADALDSLDWTVASYDRTDEPDSAAGTMDWGADQAYRGTADPPDAVVDHGAHGKEPMTKLATTTPGDLLEKLLALATEY